MRADSPALYALAGLGLLETNQPRLRQMIEELAEEAGAAGQPTAPCEALLAALPEESGVLEKEYVRLFLDPTGAPCPLWQSAYGQPRQLMGDAHFAALEWYRRYGLQTRHSNEPADHAAYLLMFYGRLLEDGADADTLRQFSEEHLQWMAPLLTKIGEETRLEFYRELAGLLTSLLEGAGVGKGGEGGEPGAGGVQNAGDAENTG